MAENLAYNNFKKFYYNLIERGGNIGVGDPMMSKEYHLKHPRRYAKFIRKNYKHINWEYYASRHNLNEFHKLIRCAVQCLWMADQSIIFKPVLRREPDPSGVVRHPGVSRLNARWAQNLSTECVIIDFNFPDYGTTEELPYTKFNNVDDAFNGLTYNNHVPTEVRISTYNEPLVDATYTLEHYKKKGFINIFWCQNLKLESHIDWHDVNVAKKYLKKYLTNPVEYGRVSFSV